MVYFIPSGLSLAVEVKNHARACLTQIVTHILQKAFFKYALEDWRISQKTVFFQKMRYETEK